MELVTGGEFAKTIRKFLAHKKKQKETVDFLWIVKFYMAELCSAIKYVHSKNVIHRDLKPENLLLSGDGHLKVIDFGIAKQIEDLQNTADTFCGTAEYLAPEIIKNQPYTKAVDWWAYGCIIFELFAGTSPFYASTMSMTCSKICEVDITWPEGEKEIPETAKDLIVQLLTYNPHIRLGNEGEDGIDIINHPFFNGIVWEELKNTTPPVNPAELPDEDLGEKDNQQSFAEGGVDEGELIEEQNAMSNLIAEDFDLNIIQKLKEKKLNTLLPNAYSAFSNLGSEMLPKGNKSKEKEKAEHEVKFQFERLIQQYLKPQKFFNNCSGFLKRDVNSVESYETSDERYKKSKVLREIYPELSKLPERPAPTTKSLLRKLKKQYQEYEHSKSLSKDFNLLLQEKAEEFAELCNGPASEKSIFEEYYYITLLDLMEEDNRISNSYCIETAPIIYPQNGENRKSVHADMLVSSVRWSENGEQFALGGLHHLKLFHFLDSRKQIEKAKHLENDPEFQSLQAEFKGEDQQTQRTLSNQSESNISLEIRVVPSDEYKGASASHFVHYSPDNNHVFFDYKRQIAKIPVEGYDETLAMVMQRNNNSNSASSKFKVLKGPNSPIEILSTSPLVNESKEKYLIAAAGNGSSTVYIFDASQQVPSMVFNAHKSSVYCLDWQKTVSESVYHALLKKQPLKYQKSVQKKTGKETTAAADKKLTNSQLGDSKKLTNSQIKLNSSLKVSGNPSEEKKKLFPLLATGGDDFSTVIFDPNTETILTKLKHHTGNVVGLSWNPKKPTVLATYGLDNRLTILDFSTLASDPDLNFDAPLNESIEKQVIVFTSVLPTRILNFKWSPNGNYFVTVGEDAVRVWILNYLPQNANSSPKATEIVEKIVNNPQKSEEEANAKEETAPQTETTQSPKEVEENSQSASDSNRLTNPVRLLEVFPKKGHCSCLDFHHEKNIFAVVLVDSVLSTAKHNPFPFLVYDLDEMKMIPNIGINEWSLNGPIFRIQWQRNGDILAVATRDKKKPITFFSLKSKANSKKNQ